METNLRESKHITATDVQGYHTLWAEETWQMVYTVKGTTDIRWVAHLFCPSSQNYLRNKWKTETFTQRKTLLFDLRQDKINSRNIDTFLFVYVRARMKHPPTTGKQGCSDLQKQCSINIHKKYNTKKNTNTLVLEVFMSFSH